MNPRLDTQMRNPQEQASFRLSHTPWTARPSCHVDKVVTEKIYLVLSEVLTICATLSANLKLSFDDRDAEARYYHCCTHDGVSSY